MGIEPMFKAWEAFVLPLNYTRRNPQTGYPQLPRWSKTGVGSIIRVFRTLAEILTSVLKC